MNNLIVNLCVHISTKLCLLIDDTEEIISYLSFKILALYNETKQFLESELSEENFDTIPNSETRVIIQITYDNK